MCGQSCFQKRPKQQSFDDVMLVLHLRKLTWNQKIPPKGTVETSTNHQFWGSIMLQPLVFVGGTSVGQLCPPFAIAILRAQQSDFQTQVIQTMWAEIPFWLQILVQFSIFDDVNKSLHFIRICRERHARYWSTPQESSKETEGTTFSLDGFEEKKKHRFPSQSEGFVFFSSLTRHESSNYQCTLSWKCGPSSSFSERQVFTYSSVRSPLQRLEKRPFFTKHVFDADWRTVSTFMFWAVFPRLVQVLWMIRVNGSATLVVESRKSHQRLIQLKTWSFRNSKACERSQWHGNWWVRHSFKETGLRKHINS